jgi:hypothetical protein
MEQTRQQVRETLAAHAPYAQVEPLWTRLRAEMEEDIKSRQDKLHADWAKIDADQRKKKKADMKAFNEMEGRKAERKAYKEKMMAEWEADRKKKADFEKSIAKRKADREEAAARLEAIQD